MLTKVKRLLRSDDTGGRRFTFEYFHPPAEQKKIPFNGTIGGEKERKQRPGSGGRIDPSFLGQGLIPDLGVGPQKER